MPGFTVQVTTTSASESVTLPFVSGQTYNCTVDWGEGSPVSVTAWDDADATHVYATPGTYTVEITGQMDGLSVNNTHSSKLQLTSIVYWGDAVDFDGFAYLTSAFYGCSNLTSLGTGEILTKAGLTSLYYCFLGCAISSIPSGLFDNCTNVQNINRIFQSTNITYAQAGLFRALVNLTSAYAVFYSCVNLKINPWIFYNDGEQSTRFLNKSIQFGECFNRASFSGSQGQAPDLWNCDFGTGTPTTTNCFAGAGNSLTSLINYNNIPAAWGGTGYVDTPPEITGVSSSDIYNGASITVSGTGFEASGGTLYVCDTDVLSDATKVPVTIDTQSDTSLTVTISGLSIAGTKYLYFVDSDSQITDSPYTVSYNQDQIQPFSISASVGSLDAVSVYVDALQGESISASIGALDSSAVYRDDIQVASMIISIGDLLIGDVYSDALQGMSLSATIAALSASKVYHDALQGTSIRLALQDSAITVGTRQYGKFFRSLNSGVTYAYLSSVPDVSISSIVEQDDGSMLCATTAASGGKGKIFKSSNGGLSWTQVFVSSYSITMYDICVFPGGIALATEEQGGAVYKSTDYGDTWSFTYDTGQVYIQDICCFSSGIAITGTGTTGRVYRSIDFGDNWSQVHDDGASYVIGGATFSNGVVLLGTSNCSILRSTNYGESFSQVTDIGSNRIACIRSLDNGSGIALASVNYGEGRLYRTTDYGQSWTMVFSSVAMTGIEDITINADGLAFFVTDNGLVYRSEDLGENWTESPYSTGENGATAIIDLPDPSITAAQIYRDVLQTLSISTHVGSLVLQGPIITSCSRSVLRPGDISEAFGVGFYSIGVALWLGDSPVFSTANKVSQTVHSQTESSIVFTVVPGSLTTGVRYLFAEDRYGVDGPPFAILFSTASDRAIPQSGDVLLYDSSDGGEITVIGGVVTMTSFIETAVYLSLFGGNREDDRSSATAKKQWWGNDGETEDRKYRGRMQSLLFGRPLTSALLPQIEKAAQDDIRHGLPTEILSSVQVSASASASKRVDLQIIVHTKAGTPYSIDMGVSL